MAECVDECSTGRVMRYKPDPLCLNVQPAPLRGLVDDGTVTFSRADHAHRGFFVGPKKLTLPRCSYCGSTKAKPGQCSQCGGPG